MQNSYTKKLLALLAACLLTVANDLVADDDSPAQADSLAQESEQPDTRRPNVLVILADDHGCFATMIE